MDSRDLCLCHLHLTPRLGGFPSEYCHAVCCGKTRMIWLPDGEKILKIRLLFLTESTNETKRQTDRRTYRQTLHDGIGCVCMASRGKNPGGVIFKFQWYWYPAHDGEEVFIYRNAYMLQQQYVGWIYGNDKLVKHDLLFITPLRVDTFRGNPTACMASIVSFWRFVQLCRANPGLFVPLHFRSRERKVHRENFRSRGTFAPWNIRSLELSLSFLGSERSKNFRSYETVVPCSGVVVPERAGTPFR